MGKHTKHTPYARKDNFWSKKRVENGVTLKDVAKLIGSTETAVGMYFSGQLMPNESIIRALCDLFDVDFNTGYVEFQHAHRNWKAERHSTVKHSVKMNKETVCDEVAEIPCEDATKNVETILEQLYGELSCKDFVAVYDCIMRGRQNTVNLAELIYGKFDFITYNKILTTFYYTNKENKDKWSI